MTSNFSSPSNYLFIYEDVEYQKGVLAPSEIESIIGYSPKTIMEFGSFDGGDGLRYKCQYPEATVYSLEADPDLFKKTQQVEKYGIHVFHAAVTNYVGEIEFNRTIHPTKGIPVGGGSILIPTLEIQEKYKEIINYSHKSVTVPCTTIEYFCKQNNITNIDFMHIDVEGAAKQVIEGFGSIRPVGLFIELILTEFSHIGGSKRTEVEKILFDLGYIFIDSNGNDCIYKLRR